MKAIKKWWEEFKKDLVFNIIMTGLMSILYLTIIYFIIWAYMEILSLG